MYDETNKGAFWKALDDNGQPRLAKNGKSFYKGKVNAGGKDFGAVLFFNPPADKTNPKQPDFTIMLSDLDGQAVKTAPPVKEIELSEIPF